MLKVDILPAFLLVGALTVSGGAWVGYKLSIAARAVLHEAPKPPPVESPPAAVEVGTLTLPQTTIYGSRHSWVAPWHHPIEAAVIPAVKFFDFHHAECDEAESVHGKVLRCQRPSR